ncbi:MAG: hypothetical protein KDD47_17045 [Acidobacteria bacterium]|nr:hypothetical protein [Acidobacteriota bacterium]
MTLPRLRRFLVPTALLAGVLVLPASPLAAAEVHWLRTADSCDQPAPGEETLLQTCGSAGRYYLTTAGTLPEVACAAEISGSEMAAFYPRANVGILGSCFERDGGPWVAVVDVRGERSKEVGFTVLQSSDGLVDAGLIDLAEIHERMPARVGLPSDAHLLAGLCDLLQNLDDGTEQAPLAVVLPFGRHLEPVPDCTTDEAHLSCQVDRVLARLRTTHGTVAVAAAGDYRATTFPASAPNALAVGTLNPGRFRVSGGAAAAWESPPGTLALAPGIGLGLDLGRTSGLRVPPPGSAAAAGFFAGWLSATLAAGAWQPPVPFPLSSAWAPRQEAQGFVLTLDGVSLPGSHFVGADLLMLRGLGLLPVTSTPVPSAPDWSLALTEEAVSLPDQTLPSLIASFTDEWPPLPVVLPCVPCANSRPDSAPPGNPQTPGTGEPEPLILDLSQSGSVGTFYQVLELALRVDDVVYRLDGGSDPALLTALTDGTVSSLAITGLDLEAATARGDSLALVFVLAYDGLPFWHSTPLAIQPEA